MTRKPFVPHPLSPVAWLRQLFGRGGPNQVRSRQRFARTLLLEGLEDRTVPIASGTAAIIVNPAGGFSVLSLPNSGSPIAIPFSDVTHNSSGKYYLNFESGSGNVKLNGTVMPQNKDPFFAVQADFDAGHVVYTYTAGNFAGGSADTFQLGNLGVTSNYGVFVSQPPTAPTLSNQLVPFGGAGVLVGDLSSSNSNGVWGFNDPVTNYHITSDPANDFVIAPDTNNGNVPALFLKAGKSITNTSAAVTVQVNNTIYSSQTANATFLIGAINLTSDIAPLAQTVNVGSKATMSVTATASSGYIVGYQWQSSPHGQNNFQATSNDSAAASYTTTTFTQVGQTDYRVDLFLEDPNNVNAFIPGDLFSSTAVVTVGQSTNHAPTANAQSVTTNTNTAVAVTLTGSDPDVGDTLTFTVTANPAHGTLSGTAPNLTYTPNAGYGGSDSFLFKATDNHGADSNTATVSIAVNHPPTANNQSVKTNANTPVAVTLTGSDPDVGDTLTFTVTASPAHGTLSGTAPNLTYTPTAGYGGSDSFQFKATDNHGADSNTATVSIAVNHPPTANNQSVNAITNTPVAVTLTGSDPDVGDTLTFIVTASPTHGTLSGTAPNLTYTPTAGYGGPDSFQFKANDGQADSNTATVSINVANQAPTLTGINPTSALVGSGNTTITLTGANFTPSATADFNGSPLSTTFVNSTQLTAVIPAADFAAAGVNAITVVISGQGGGTSAPQTFTVTNPAPTLASINPTSAPVGSGNTTITLTGTNFINGSTAAFNGTALATTFVSSTQLSAVIPAADLAAPVTAAITVVTAGPGGGTSAAQTFTVVSTTPPTITSNNSTSVTAGSSLSFQVTTTGTPAVSAFSLSSAPGFLSISNSGLLTGTPTVATTYQFTINASNGVAPDAHQSFTLTVTPGRATSVTVNGPTTVTAGTAYSYTVMAFDANGNLATGYTGPITFTTTDGTARLPQPFNLVGGAGSNTVTFRSGGTFTLTATGPNPAGGATLTNNLNNIQSTLAVTQTGGVVIDDGTAQRSMVRSLTLTFQGDVNVTANLFALTVKNAANPTGAQVALAVGGSTLVNGNTQVKLTFVSDPGDGATVGGSLFDGQYVLTSQGTTQATFWRLFGDANGEGKVTTADQALFNAAYGSRRGQAKYNSIFDYDANGFVTGNDRGAFQSNLGKSIDANGNVS